MRLSEQTNRNVDHHAQNMRQFWVVGVVLALAGAGVLNAQTAPQQADPQPAQPAQPADSAEGTPKAVVDNPVHDFGTTWLGEPLAHTFIIRNEGNAVLEITNVRPSCGCTKAGPMPDKIAPGASGEFPFTLASSKLHGKYSKDIQIQTNDPNNSMFKLTLAGECKRYVELQPANINFGQIADPTVEQEKVIKITNNTETPLTLTLGEPSPTSKFRYELVETTPGKEFDLKVITSVPIAAGRHKEVVDLNTNIEAQKKVTVNILAQVLERLDVFPNPLQFSKAPEGQQGLTRRLTFTNNGPSPVKLLEATCDDEKIVLAVTEQTPGKKYAVNVTIPGGYEVPEEGRTITLKTDDAEKPVLTVPVRPIKSIARDTKQQQPTKRPAEELVGQPMPAFAASTHDGKSVSNSELAGQVAVLDFFAPNCPHCKKQIPKMEKVREEYEAKGVRFIAVSQTMRKQFTNEEVLDVLKQLGAHCEVVMDHGNTIGPLFKARSYPTLFVVGKDGKIESAHVGNKPTLEQDLKQELDKLLAAGPATGAAATVTPAATP